MFTWNCIWLCKCLIVSTDVYWIIYWWYRSVSKYFLTLCLAILKPARSLTALFALLRWFASSHLSEEALAKHTKVVGRVLIEGLFVKAGWACPHKDSLRKLAFISPHTSILQSFSLSTKNLDSKFVQLNSLNKELSFTQRPSISLNEAIFRNRLPANIDKSGP